MAKSRRQFVCRSCGSLQARWMGKCPACGAWDSLEEHVIEVSASKDPHASLARSWSRPQKGKAALAGSGAGGAHTLEAADLLLEAPRAVPMRDAASTGGPIERMATGIGELDRVLGGGIVPASVVLLGGDPGIGKSTLLLQALGALAQQGERCLYVTTEESAEQVRLRADRLGAAELDQLYVLADTNLARIVEQARQVQPDLLVLDSVQMVYKADLDAAPGSIAQLRRCATELVYLAKVSGMAVVLVGHVTKEGTLAGPRLLEHLVDVVLYFEGDRDHAHRIVRSVKNRFGTTLEIGLFEMTGDGLQEIADAAAALAPGEAEARPGSAICPVMTGARCLLVEIQALTATGFPGAAKRRSSGLDVNRLAMLIAVLEQHAGVRLADRDVFASAAGGIRVSEPAADLALSLAIASSHLRRPLEPGTAVIGEIGLGGEVRPVNQLEARLREAARLGYRRAIIPAPRRNHVDAQALGIELLPVRDITQAIQWLS
jgi:DNA repair protein RadA/Sms